MWHDFQLYAGQVPDATESVEEMARFIVEQLALAAQRQSGPALGAARPVDHLSSSICNN